MAGLLRKLRPSVPAVPDTDDDENVNTDYSIASVYHGPPVTYDIPKVVPVDISQVPVAAPVSSAFLLNSLSLPLVQPIVKSRHSKQKSSTLGSQGIGTDNFRSLARDRSYGSGSKAKLSDGIESSETLGFSGVLDSSEELSPRSCLLEVRGDDDDDDDDDEKEGERLARYMNPSAEAGLSSTVHAFSCRENHRNDETPHHVKRPSIVTSRDPELNDIGCREDDGSDEAPHHVRRPSIVTSSDAESSDISCREDDGNGEAPHHVKKPSTVTFRDPESRETVVHEESCQSDEGSVSVTPKVAGKVKKGVCYRCLKGNRFTEKEVCIVCGAKYCYDCVLRAMGSMPEGRKCVTCIGMRINEARRGMLGTCSRTFKRLLDDLEVKRIMGDEVSCKVNQVSPRFIFVNDEPLSQEELTELQNCKNPPKKLRPGCYWYDKVSGFWGKVGQKPSQFITPDLNIRSKINRNASRGNAGVFINEREITKEELWMLKVAGVQCEGGPRFWVNNDGSYREEGQKERKGKKIWDRNRTKLLCAALSLPVPPGSPEEAANGVVEDEPARKLPYKFLLVGTGKSGTSTIYKQAKLLYDVPFSEPERQAIKFVIQKNLYVYLAILLEGRERFEEQCLLEKPKRCVIEKSVPSATGDTSHIDDTTIYSVGPRVKDFSDWLLQAMVLGNLETIFPAATHQYAPIIEELWKDPAIQATYDRRNELEMLPRAASCFLDRAVEISRTDYEPSETDILFCEGISDTLACVEFSFPNSPSDESLDPDYQHDSSIRYQLLRVHPRNLGVNCKWLHMFEDSDIIVFCVSLTAYDEFSEEFDGVLTNRMLASKKLFESIVTHPSSRNKNFLLILTKFDLLEESIEQVPLKRCEWFHDFNPVTSQYNPNSTNPSLAQRAFHYIATKFKRLFHSLTGRKLFVSRVIALENDAVDEALRYAREIVLWEEDKPQLLPESSTTDFETTTTL